MYSSKNTGKSSISITVKFYGVFRNVVGKEKITHRTIGTGTLRQVINELTSKFPSQFKETLIDPILGDSTPNAIILINGKDINVLDGLETIPKDGDEIAIIPVAHGG